MSVEPPSSGRPSEPPTQPTGQPGGRPSGPPSGPLSGPSQPPSGPPSEPPDGDSPAGGGWEPRRPWWKSAPRVALVTTAVVAATALALVLTLPDGGGSDKAGEVFMQPAGEAGPDGFTQKTNNAGSSSVPPATASPSGSSPPANTVPGVGGGQAGLYGGTLHVASCDVELQIKYLQEVPAKNRAFASVIGIDPSQVPGYLRSLTPVNLRLDTRVTNHGYRNGAATTYQAVLQAGTAVMVDRYGVPRVRCACGNPLAPPVAQQSGYKRTGRTWPSYSPSTTVVVNASVTVVNVFVLYDPASDHHWIARRPGNKVHQDRPTRPPARLTPSVGVSTPTGPGSRTSPPCVSPPTGGASGRPPGCLPPSSGASSRPPSSESPSSESQSSESQKSEPPSSGSGSSESGHSEPSSSLSALTGEPESSLSSLAQSPPSVGVTSRSSSASAGSSAAAPAV
ncbi:DUF6777 domain-containing protein [Streptomyces sp. NBC_01235]|uniref:DUF6777 domain-containing protein n=1 Tax=Streptomyces sp. NBC_01235 TaxID=2903788 RepID=UPI002E10AF82|nr:hypothetical protein OG289_02440 [Streptomyces sp. NBC_01235]